MKTLHRPLLHGLRDVIVLLLLIAAWQTIAAAPAVRITYLYDNTVAAPAPDGARAGWGFAALVEAGGRRVLFDTGGDAAILRDNAAALGVDLGRLDALVLSHEHWDHTKGLPVLGAQPGLPVYHPAGVDPLSPWLAGLRNAGMQGRPVRGATEVVPGVQVSAALPSPMGVELALAIDTDDGVVVLMGCAHPGPVALLRAIRAERGRAVQAVIGGWHLLMSLPSEIDATLAAFEAEGVQRVGPTHCTGALAIGRTRHRFGDRFIEGGVGTVVEFGPFERTAGRR